MLIPKRVKRRKQHRGKIRGRAQKGNQIAYGEYGLVAEEGARIIDIFPHKPITKHPAESRMGSGKGAVEYWVAIVKPGRVMFEMSGVNEDVAREAMRLASHKLPVKCKFIKKEVVEEGGEANES